MKIFKGRQLKSALVLLLTMLIFCVSVPDCAVLTAHAENDEDIIIIFDDDDEIEDDDEDYEDYEDDDEDEEEDSEDENYESGNKSEIVTEPQTVQAADKKDKKEKVTRKEYKTHRKVTVELGKKNPTYYDKLTVGDDLRISVKIKGQKLKNKKVKFSSSKKSVASVTKDGVITAKKNGTAKIRISNRANRSEKCTMIITVASSTVRTLFIGDSRTVDIFSGSVPSVLGEVHSNVVVCALNGGNVNFMNEVINHSDLSDYDTIITWMGCNDYGAFKPYKKSYSKLLSSRKRLVLCTVGASGDEYLWPEAIPLFCNGVITGFNAQMKKWAKKKNVKTIPLYEYVQKNLTIDEKDGIHYSPKPNKTLWRYILDNAK